MNTFFFFLIANIQAVASEKTTFVTLTPHLAELVHSAGAGEQLIGTSRFSDYPTSVKTLPVIGDAFNINLESLVALNPDYVLYWDHNLPAEKIHQIEQLGLKTQAITTQTLDDIPKAINTIAELAGTQVNAATTRFNNTIQQMRNHEPMGTALIQISDDPIYTVNDNHIMSEAMSICGLENAFADLPMPSMTLSIESIIATNPDHIIRFSPLPDTHALHHWPDLTAVKENQIIQVNPDHFTRPTLRILQAIEQICQATKKPVQ